MSQVRYGAIIKINDDISEQICIRAECSALLRQIYSNEIINSSACLKFPPTFSNFMSHAHLWQHTDFKFYFELFGAFSLKIAR